MDTQQIIMIVVIGLLLVAMIVLPMITQKKRQKAVQEMHNSIGVGDKIKTVGGIVGVIVAINEINALEKEFVLETGQEGSKCTMVFDFNAIYQVMAKRGAKPAEEKTEEKKD
ncbi:MAG: preprotein translocase subunit YajC [Clostridia bacterium]|nr:preprotein translocase subunit YajC [Clostridia bacterium]